MRRMAWRGIRFVVDERQERRSRGRGNTEEDFELAQVVLVAVRAERVEHAGVEALERFENGDAGSEWWERRAPRGKENTRSDDGKKEVSHPRHSQDGGCHFHSQDD